MTKRHRGRASETVITFTLFVQLISDALLQHQGSSHRAFQEAKDRGELEAAIQAAYGKLKRVPLSLSRGLFVEVTRRLEDVYPATERAIPPSLQDFEPTALDGKKIKHVAKRMKVTRHLKGQVLGGKLVPVLPTTATAAHVAERLRDVLHGQWHNRWLKAPTRKHKPPTYEKRIPQ